MLPYDVDSVTTTPHLTNNSILPWVDVENLRSNQCLQSFVRVNSPASQPQFYEHIQESKDVFQDKTYSYQVSFFMGIGH